MFGRKQDKSLPDHLTPPGRMDLNTTYPPLKAPTGFRTGNGVTTSASLLDDVWKLLVVRRAAEGVARARMAGDSMRDAIVLDRRRAPLEDDMI